jgi:NAD(P)-dependent dehydrogenase (short-subunit alcohol dehydrogenase family)
MNNPLAGKTVLITGGSHRIGKAIALSFAAEKANCVIHCLPKNRERADALSAEIKALGVKAHVLSADFSKPAGTRKIFPSLQKKGIRIDYLIHNASVFEKSRLLEITTEQLSYDLSVNTFSALILAQGFVGQTRNGVIINILDTRISGYDREYTGYLLSKTMLSRLTRLMAVEFAPGIRVNAVAPGIILPPEGKNSAYLKKIQKRTLLGRHGTTGHVTDSILFLVKNDFITGETLFVDGGEHLKQGHNG